VYIDYTIESETMKGIHRIKKERSIKNSRPTPEEIWQKEQEAADEFTVETGHQFIFADPRQTGMPIGAMPPALPSGKAINAV
jgi:hypothetical protein